MKIVLMKNDKLYKYSFPSENLNDYWIKDFDKNDNERDLISMDKIRGSWYLFSNEICSVISNGKKCKEAEFIQDVFYPLAINNNGEIETAYIYYDEENDESFKSYHVFEDGEYRIGNDSSCQIVLPSNAIASQYAVLTRKDNHFYIRTINYNNLIYVNNNRISQRMLESGDTAFIFGYRIIVVDDYILLNKDASFNSEYGKEEKLPSQMGDLIKTIEDDNATLYLDSDYFDRQPRFTTSITEEDIKIDNPPGKVEPDDTPLIYTLGPMLTMTMTSVVSVSTSIINIKNGNGSTVSIVLTLVLAVAMLASTLLWPSLLKRYNNKKQLKKEEERQKKYSKYLEEKRKRLTNIRKDQFEILSNNYPDINTMQSIILNKKRNLWERQVDSEDFLHVRVGVGDVPLKVKLSYAMEDFTMIEDNLKKALTSLADETKDIKECPVTIDLTVRNKLVIIGDTANRESMIKSILLQLATYHAYNDLKFVFMINDTISEIWENFKILPHTWSDSKDIRFFAKDYDEMNKISFYLEQVFTARKYSQDDDKQVETDITYKNVRPYYLIIIDNIKKTKNIDIVDKILKEDRNLGFGIIILNERISNLPNECKDFLSAKQDQSSIVTNDLNKDKQEFFRMDNVGNVNLGVLCEKLSNIPIKSNQMFNELKNSVGFLEMYKVGRVEQLNAIERWKNNNIINSLSVPIGIKADGELFTLDLHEKFHGPHGLIAGMTGSGKSEFIITYILSMCINFSPEEVSFVLIDYKGGGLTGAFENKLTGVRLPHLAGTITNLDTAEIKRSLASIQSELKRRQEVFNEAKLKLNLSTLDIYKYQDLYRSGLVDEPISHLFIISDEFAELKSQQSEFMSELISAARIGRSLGVHLILATQKPSGIVDDQIWSNSKFKVCLKVQEKSDSMDVIKRPDAVTLKKAGRFYLQVGYNDYFAIGQAAYAGTKYIPKDKITKQVDRDISFINNIGDTIKNVETVERVETVSQGEELSNVLRYICDSAKSLNLVAQQLWLDKIDSEIYVTNLMKKYNFRSQPWDLRTVIGEYDDPSNQRQDLLVLDFNDGGNTLIYGASNKEIMIATIIYGLIINHSSDEVNIYIIDFGSEMFGTFVSAPQVGDVVYVNETEKLVNLFNVVTRELERRKKLFADYNGSYNLFIKNSGKKLPRIIIFINNYEILNENYEDYVDIVASLTREGEKYGISFVISATGVNAVRGKTTQNFNKQFCLQFNDPSDYMSILGSTHGMIPSEIEGRGLFKLDGNIYEFQTAYPYKWDEINPFIKNICAQLNERLAKKASKIAILPEHVRLEDVTEGISDFRSVPIGIEKESLAISTIDISKAPVSLIGGQDSSILNKFIPSLTQVLQKMPNTEAYLVDAGEEVSDATGITNYFNSNFEEVYNKIKTLSESDINKQYAFVIYGVESFFNAFDEEKQRELKSLLSNLKNKKDIRIIFADSISKIKMYEYEDFYRNTVQPINGVWIGSGVTDQYTIKCSTYNRATRAQIPNDFGYNINKGNATFVKLLDFYTEE